MIFTVICTDCAPGIHWQCELLEYSWCKLGQPGELIRLVSAEEDTPLPEHRHARVIRTKFTNSPPDVDDLYPPYNRLYSLQEWLQSENPQGTVLIVDPDMLFRDSLDIEVQPNSPIGQHWVDFALSEPKKKIAREASGVDIARIQPITWPALIHTSDLHRLMPRWIALTIAYRLGTGGWEDDMVAFAVAAAEIGLVFSFKKTAAWIPWPEDKVSDAPILHYCQPIEGIGGEVLWNKYKYVPWERVETGEKTRFDYCQDMLTIIGEYARLRNVSTRFEGKTIFIAIAAYCEPELIDTIESCLLRAFRPENLRFGICLQYDNDGGPKTQDDCLDIYLQDSRVKFVKYDFRQSKGGCWARNLSQQFYDGEDYTLQIDAHSQLIEGWDALLIEMLEGMPADKPLITSFPPLYTRDEENRVVLSYLHQLDRVPTTMAGDWKQEGWIEHPQKYIPENNIQPRRTRFLSGAFVFTLGRWNVEVQQDPEHFYTGEEFALALRSHTHGYDLFDPTQIVVWHRLHPAPNRKFWHDNQKEETETRHLEAISRLRLLLAGDPEGTLGRFGLGNTRTLEDFKNYSGLDCTNQTVHPDASAGIPPDPDPLTAVRVDDEAALGDGASVIELTLHLEGRAPLELMCQDDDPMLATLFTAMLNNDADEATDNLIYLQYDDVSPKTVYLFGSQINAIETQPHLETGYLGQLVSAIAECEATPVSPSPFDDSWKFWIWDNVRRGCDRSELFATLLKNGFRYEDIRSELSFDPSIETAGSAGIQVELPEQTPYLIANSVRLNNPEIELYTVDDFLNEQECESLMALLKEDNRPSTVVDEVDDRKGRTSRTSYFGSDGVLEPLAAEVQRRICQLIGINPTYAESIQGHWYRSGEQYTPHFDWFDPRSSDPVVIKQMSNGGQRTWSVIVYLNDVQEGGETRFVSINEDIEPRQGKLVVWNNLLPSKNPNTRVLHQAMPVVSGEKAILTLWFRSEGDGQERIREPGEEIKNYTPRGFKAATMPRDLFAKLNTFYHANSSNQEKESIPNYLFNERQDLSASDLIMLPRTLKVEISHCLKPIMEQWSGQKLESTAVYGLRRYRRGATLKVHRDVTETHIISAILNIEQQVDKDWPLVIEDNYYRRHTLFLRPGDLVLYEGARLLHGRPTPLEGEEFCNIFVHFMPRCDGVTEGPDIRV